MRYKICYTEAMTVYKNIIVGRTQKYSKILKKICLILMIFLFQIFFSGTSVLADEFEDADFTDPHQDLMVNMDDLYITNYEKVSVEGSDEVVEKTLKDMSELLSAGEGTISEEEVKAILGGEVANQKSCVSKFEGDSEHSGTEMCLTPLVRKYCNLETPNNFDGYVECQKKMRKIYSDRLKKNVLAKRLEKSTRTSQAFLNGTLKDTNNQKFDIIIDFNILDVILFGDKFTAPQNSSPFFPHPSIVQLFQNEEDRRNNEAENTGSGNTQDAGENTTGNAENSDSSEHNQPEENSSGSRNTPENSSSVSSETGNNASSSENNNSGNVNLSGFCIDPDVLIFSGNGGSDSGNISGGENTNTDSGTQNTDENSNTNTNEDSENSSSFVSSLSQEEMQNGSYFSAADRENTDSYPDIEALKKEERKRGFRKDCSEKERPLFGGRMCVPDFCTEVFCVRVFVTEGHKQTNLRPLDCVECHIDKGNEALTPLVSVLGQNTPHTNPMEPNFMGAFATFGGTFTGVKVYTQAKKLPFLIYDQGDSLTDQKNKKKKAAEKKSKTPEENAKSEGEEQSKEEEERLAKFVDNNTKLYEFMTYNCSNLPENIGENMSDKAEFCARYTKEMTQKHTDDAQKELNSVYNKQKSNGYKTVVEPWFYQFSEDMRQINMELEKIDSEAIKQAAHQCS